MQQRLFTLAIAALSLGFGLLAAPSALASTNQLVTTTNVTKTSYLKRNDATAIYNMSGAANHLQITKTAMMRQYGNAAWFVSKQRTVRTDHQLQKYYYVTKTDNRARGWVKCGGVVKNPDSFTNLYDVARSKLGDRYVYGATGPNRFDCSGYTQYCFKQATHKVLPRVAEAQYRAYPKIAARNAKPGDLVFFGTNTGHISHVGIYVGGGKMIDAQDSGVKDEKVYVPWWHAVGYARPVNFTA